MLSTQVARPLVEIFFGRIDGRTASNRATGELLNRYFPGPYDLVRARGGPTPSRSSPGPGAGADRLRAPDEERGALRLFLRALRRMPAGLDWEAFVFGATPADADDAGARSAARAGRLVGPPDGYEEAADGRRRRPRRSPPAGSAPPPG